MPTLTTYPVDGAVSPCDGPVNLVSQNAVFSTLIATQGNQGGLTSLTSDIHVGLQASTTTNQFQYLRRSILNFDTSSIGVTSEVTSATLSLVYNFIATDLGTDNVHICNAFPASTAAIPTTDFQNIGNTSFSSIAIGSLASDNSTYNDFTLNSLGKDWIKRAGITSFGEKLGWDLTETFGGVWSSSATTRIQGIFADEAGTSKDPKLVVVYTEGVYTYKTLVQGSI